MTYFPDTGLQHLGFLQQPPDRRPELSGQFLQASAYHVAQLDTFEVTPYPLVRVLFRSIPGQLLQLYALGRSLRQPLPHRRMGAPSQITSSLPGISSSNCSKKRITSGPL